MRSRGEIIKIPVQDPKCPTLLFWGKEMKEKETETIKAGDPKDIVKSRYDACAEQGGGEGAVCCAGDTPASPSFAAEHGLYSREELSLVPKIAFTLSRGCGNPTPSSPGTAPGSWRCETPYCEAA